MHVWKKQYVALHMIFDGSRIGLNASYMVDALEDKWAAWIKTIYGSRVMALENLAGELDDNSQSTYRQLNSEVSKHSSALEEV
ncbi:hypothetical protein ACS0TY_019627 [Phlomoides rotata]